MGMMNRRNVLHGMMGGMAVTVGLPFLDCFLNSSGTAFANGAALPVVFGSWNQALGFNPGFWEPKTVGANYENNVQFKPLDPFKNRINIFSGMKAILDSNPLQPHVTGPQVCLSGGIPHGNDAFPSIDTLISEVIGSRTRFRSLEVACDGTPASYSKRSGSSNNPSERSPAALYMRIFGPEFKDPNAADFTPDPKMMARKSMLSAVMEQKADLAKKLGASDKVRLDEYFTSLRELEQQIDLQLQKPAPLEACTVPGKVEEANLGPVVDDVRANHRLFAGLLAHAVACGQTRVVNVLHAGLELRRPGSAQTFHTYTHEEAVDEKLGYQPTVAWLQDQCIKSFVEFLAAFDSIKEGDHTLLDRSLMLYSTDHGLAKLHSVENIPMMTAGSAGGRLKTGIHVTAPGNTVSRVGLTVQMAMGVPVSTWGTESNKTSKPFTEILA